MRTANKGAMRSAVVLCACVLISPAAAQDASKEDGFASWGKASTEELAQQRAGATAIAEATAEAVQTFTVNGTVEAGTVTLTDNAINESNMSITAINTGNNVVMTNSLAIVINLAPPP